MPRTFRSDDEKVLQLFLFLALVGLNGCATDPVRVAQLNTIVHRIGAVMHLPNMPCTVTLFHTNIVNAAAFPGGPMMVFAGLYDPRRGLVHDDDKMAAVMAHELAHVNCRHTTRRLSVVTPYALAAENGAAVRRPRISSSGRRSSWAVSRWSARSRGDALKFSKH